MRITLNVEIDTETKTVFISHGLSTGCEFDAKTPTEIAQAVMDYLEMYIELEKNESPDGTASIC